MSANQPQGQPVAAPQGQQPVAASKPTYEQLLAMVTELQAKANQPKNGITFTIAEKGGVSAVGIGRFPTTLYYEQWVKLLDAAEEQGLRRQLAQWLSEGKILLKGSKDETAQSIMQRSVSRGQADLAALNPSASQPVSK